MGKLNSLIKFVVFNANALLFLGGIGMIAVASLLLTADFKELAKVSSGRHKGCVFGWSLSSRAGKYGQKRIKSTLYFSVGKES